MSSSKPQTPKPRYVSYSELTLALDGLQRRILEQIQPMVRDEIRRCVRAELDQQKSTIVKDVKNELDGGMQLVIARNNDLQVQTVKQISNEVGAKIYKKIVDDINTKIVPQVERVAEWVNYNVQDGTEIVNEYRQGVQRAATSGHLAIKAGDSRANAVSEFQRKTFCFTDDDL